MARHLTSSLILLAIFAAAGSAQPQNGAGLLRRQLSDRLESIASRLDGVMGYSVVDLTSGSRIERLATEAFPTASSIKLAILYELFKQSEEGSVKLDAPIAWDRGRAVGGSGILFELSSPTLSLRDYATLMVVLSDNTATNVIIDVVGMDRVNARMQALGLGEVRLRRKMMDFAAAKSGRENVATPAALAGLLAIINEGRGLSGASRDAMLAILQKGKSSPMLRGIPAGVRVASKPGDLDGVRADAGVVYIEGRPYIFVAMASWLQRDEDGERAIEELSRATYQYFERLAASSEYGRKLR